MSTAELEAKSVPRLESGGGPPVSRALPVVLRRLLAAESGAVLLIGKVVAVPDAEHVRIEQHGKQVTIPRLSGYLPTVGEPAYCVAARTVTVAVGAVGGAVAAGEIGPQGPPGPQGETGATGATGPPGPQGVQGNPGPTGPQGAAGSGVTMKGSVATSAALPPTGNTQGDAYIVQADDSLWLWDGTTWVSGGSIQGPPGPQGIQGVQGPTGATGATGATGNTGPQGNPGVQGPPGPEGPEGDVGPQGPQGIKGDTGATGSQGPPGTQGVQGVPGTAGTPGEKWWTGAGAPPGATGAVGDWWLDSSSGDYHEKTGASTWTLRGNLKGPQGAQGTQGPQGATGSTGSQGPQGNPGTAGAPGSVWRSGAGAPATGLGVVGDWYLNTTNGDVHEKTGSSTWTLRDNITGPQGLQGPQGTQGPQGVKGDTGATGSQGPAGATGSPGPQGETGATGDTGPQGPQGIKGDTGAQGPAGPSGASTFMSGTGAPTAGMGVDGAIYLDTATGKMWGPKAAGAWPGAPLGRLLLPGNTYSDVGAEYGNYAALKAG